MTNYIDFEKKMNKPCLYTDLTVLQGHYDKRLVC